MARLDYASSDTPAGPDGPIIDRIRTRRGGTLRPLDLMLLHSPPLADGWNDFLGAVRSGTILADDVRELAILRVAALNDAQYEWDAHEPLGQAGGLTDSDLAVLRGEPRSDRLEPRLAAALAYTDAMTAEVSVPEDVFDSLRRHFNEREVVELTVTVGAYNLVSRVLVALEVGQEEPPSSPNTGGEDQERA
ncbi:carboxymuconolactone decarboxylase family protein [Saccharopolyspora sp. NPDC049426]|uniref:carboxymuconolactone decarboxylase family protein n=1 Tax=Saccharopolyspora sp. NPDC049426 TaxID=3155652 RepID=UPI003437EE47